MEVIQKEEIEAFEILKEHKVIHLLKGINMMFKVKSKKVPSKHKVDGSAWRDICCSCLLQGFPAMLAFFIPVALCVFVNTISFVFILRSLMKSGSTVTSTKKTSEVEQARRGAAISVYLGLTWIFGLLAIRDAKLLFQYLFCIFNSLQGFLIFLFYCVLSTEVRAKYRSRFCNQESSNPQAEEAIASTSITTTLEMKQLTAAAEHSTTSGHINTMVDADKYGEPSQ